MDATDELLALTPTGVKKTRSIRRQEEMAAVKAALAEVHVTPGTVEKAVPVVRDLEPWFADAPLWAAQLDERLQQIIRRKCLPSRACCVMLLVPGCSIILCRAWC